MINEDHRVICWNKALEELSGISSETVLGTRQHWRAFYASKRPCMADLLVAEAFEGIERWYAGKYCRSALIEDAFEAIDFFPDLGENGKWLHFTAAIVRSSQNTLIGAIETLEDITERKIAEHALLKANDDLEVRVRERTKELLKSSQALKAEVEERRQAEIILRKQERELKAKSIDLEEVNMALKVLLKQRENDKKELEEKILTNVNEGLLPYVEKLKKSNLDVHQRTNVEMIEKNLKEIISPFIKSLTTKYLNLTPKEVQVASLVKEGKTTKEIADFLNTSTAAIDFHRNHIRMKLGLKNNKVNLRTYLLTSL